MDTLVRHGMWLIMLGSLTACSAMSAPDYSSRYVRVANGGGYLPQACLMENNFIQHTAAHLLPPGCANALNLMEMAVDQADLQRGRAMGPALVAPAAGAVERYLKGAQQAQEEIREDRLRRESTVSE